MPPEDPAVFGFTLCKFQRRTVPSWPAEARVAVGENATPKTGPSCPLKNSPGAGSPPLGRLSTFQIRIVPSWPDEARVESSGENATPETQPS